MDQNTATDDWLLPIRPVCRRYGVVPRTIDRRIESGAFPKPDQIVNNRRYWWNSTLRQHELQAASSKMEAV